MTILPMSPVPNDPQQLNLEHVSNCKDCYIFMLGRDYSNEEILSLWESGRLRPCKLNDCPHIFSYVYNSEHDFCSIEHREDYFESIGGGRMYPAFYHEEEESA